MGLHAFDSEPEHCAVYRSHVGPNLPPLFGFEDRWNMPASRHRRSLGAGMDFRGVNHYVLTYHIGGASARRAQPALGGAALTGCISLQAPESAGRFTSRGVVEYGHFYFKQGLISEVAAEMDMSTAAAPEDFFAIQDSAWGRDVDSYLLRASDREDPPTSMEMDSRAYLIIVGLLRVTHKRDDLRDALPEVGRADMRRVLDMIEDRLGDQLRVSDLSSLVDMSPFHFTRVFKEATGESPAQYLMRRRTERALELTRTTNLSLSEVAFRTGFSSQSHMTRSVKAASGLTPGRIRSDV